jgi:hypothetical protein
MNRRGRDIAQPTETAIRSYPTMAPMSETCHPTHTHTLRTPQMESRGILGKHSASAVVAMRRSGPTKNMFRGTWRMTRLPRSSDIRPKMLEPKS